MRLVTAATVPRRSSSTATLETASKIDGDACGSVSTSRLTAMATASGSPVATHWPLAKAIQVVEVRVDMARG